MRAALPTREDGDLPWNVPWIVDELRVENGGVIMHTLPMVLHRVTARDGVHDEVRLAVCSSQLEETLQSGEAHFIFGTICHEKSCTRL